MKRSLHSKLPSTSVKTSTPYGTPKPPSKQNVKQKQQLGKLQNQLTEQDQVIRSLKNLVVYKKSDDCMRKTEFDKKLQSYIGSTVTEDIQEALDGLTYQYSTNKQKIKAAQARQLERTPEPVKLSEKCVGTTDDFNILLAAANGSPQRFLGELCFEIEWRILYHVFGSTTTLYGVSTRQIEAKIRECSTNFLTLQPDYERRDHLIKRFEEVLTALSEVGYKRQYHPSLTEHYITKFGHFSVEKMPKLQLSPGRYTRQLLKEIFRLHWSDYKTDKNQRNEWTEVKVLVDSLLKLADFDGKPMFSWDERRAMVELQTNGRLFNNWDS